MNFCLAFELQNEEKLINQTQLEALSSIFRNGIKAENERFMEIKFDSVREMKKAYCL